MTQNRLGGVPQTDAEVEKFFQDYSADTRRLLHGIYKTRRAKGEDVSLAYRNTLDEHIEQAYRSPWFKETVST